MMSSDAIPSRGLEDGDDGAAPLRGGRRPEAVFGGRLHAAPRLELGPAASTQGACDVLADGEGRMQRGTRQKRER